VHRLGLVLSSGASIGRPAVPAVARLEIRDRICLFFIVREEFSEKEKRSD
jgi:hypothetical protein